MSDRARQVQRRETLAYWPALQAGSEEQIGLVTNITETGLSMHSSHDFTLGQQMPLRIAVDQHLTGSEPIAVKVEVVWCEKSAFGELYHAGFKLLHPTEASLATIRKLLDNFSYTAPEEQDAPPLATSSGGDMPNGQLGS